jgi:hypothetical protein
MVGQLGAVGAEDVAIADPHPVDGERFEQPVRAVVGGEQHWGGVPTTSSSR